MADEKQKSTASVIADKPLTDKELEEILHKSEKVTDFPEVTFDEFTAPNWDEWVEACNALLKGKPFDKIMYTKTMKVLPLILSTPVKAPMKSCRQMIIPAWAISCVVQL